LVTIELTLQAVATSCNRSQCYKETENISTGGITI